MRLELRTFNVISAIRTATLITLTISLIGYQRSFTRCLNLPTFLDKLSIIVVSAKTQTRMENLLSESLQTADYRCYGDLVH